jgi:hypothetical protein
MSTRPLVLLQSIISIRRKNVRVVYKMDIPAFQKTVVVVAAVLLLLSLAVVGVALYRHRSHETFPPVIGSCPDYWDDVTPRDGSPGTVCKNLGINPPASHEGSSGSLSCPGKGGVQAFKSSLWRGKSGLCRKATWARQCGVIWDGVTNSNEKCDDGMYGAA